MRALAASVFLFALLMSLSGCASKLARTHQLVGPTGEIRFEGLAKADLGYELVEAEGKARGAWILFGLIRVKGENKKGILASTPETMLKNPFAGLAGLWPDPVFAAAVYDAIEKADADLLTLPRVKRRRVRYIPLFPLYTTEEVIVKGKAIRLTK